MSLASVLARKGAPVTFTHSTPGTYDAGTDTSTPPTTVTVTGLAMQIDGDPEAYAALGLIQSENPMLLFKPDTRGVMPVLGSTVVWGGEPFIVKDVETLAMAGVATAARVRVSR
jgi:hypothetical protein